MNTLKSSPSRSREEISLLIESYRQSGQNKKAFARQNGINYMTFIGWCAREAEQKKIGKADAFIALKVKDERKEIFAEVFLKNGMRVCFHQRVGVEYFQLLLK